MINKVAFKKFIKEGSKRAICIDEKSSLVSDGCAAYVVTPEIQKILNDFVAKGGELKPLDLSEYMNINYLGFSKLTKTSGLIEKELGQLARVMMDYNGKNNQIQQAYLDVLGKNEEFIYRQEKEFQPVYCTDKDDVLIGFILPIRPIGDEYEVNYKGNLEESNKQWGQMYKENRELYRELERISPESAERWEVKRQEQIKSAFQN